jgi:diadenosine tetraphosphate (Ap4A) HIT family hydrolase
MTESVFDMNCCLCTELNGGEFPLEYRAFYEVEDRICMQTKNFVAIPALTPLCEGHLLILPRDHLTCLSGMERKLADELRIFLSKVADKVTEQYGTIYYFEHGVVRAGDQACGINHAHLHILPMETNQALAVGKLISQEFPSAKETSFDTVLNSPTPDKAYLMYGASLNDLQMAESNQIPSQIIRRTVAKICGFQNVGWKVLGGVDAFVATRNQFMEQAR